MDLILFPVIPLDSTKMKSHPDVATQPSRGLGNKSKDTVRPSQNGKA